MGLGQKPSIGSVVVVVGSDEKAAAALWLACTERSPLLTTVIAVGDEAALTRLGVGSAGGPTEKTGIIDAAVHSVDYEAKILLTTPRCIDRQPLSDWHSEERLLFFDELVGCDKRGSCVVHVSDSCLHEMKQQPHAWSV